MKRSAAHIDSSTREASTRATGRRLAAMVSFLAVLAAATGWSGGIGTKPLRYEGSAFGIHGAYSNFPWFETRMGFQRDDYCAWANGHMRALGAHFTRINVMFIWDVIEPVLGGGYDWNALGGDDTLKSLYAEGNGINALVGIDVGQQSGQRDPLDHPEAFTRFIQHLVERYDGDGIDDVSAAVPVRVTYWQAGNEWPEWVRGGHSRAEYVQLAKRIEQGVHAADPEAKVVLIAQMDTDPLGTWWKQTVLDLKGIINVVDLHDWNNAPRWKMAHLVEARSWLDANAMTDVPIWTGEDATYVGTPDVQPFQTLEDQARFLVKRICWSRAHGLDKFFWSLLVDRYQFAGNPKSLFNSIGLIGDGQQNNEPVPDGVSGGFNARRNSYWAYRLLARHTDARVADQLGEMPLTDDVTRWGYEYRSRADGGALYVVWTEGGRQKLSFAVASGSVHVTDMIDVDEAGTFATGYDLRAVGGRVALTVGDNPLLVVENEPRARRTRGRLFPIAAGHQASVSDISEIFGKLHVVTGQDTATTQAGYDDAWRLGMRGLRSSLLWDTLEPTRNAPLPRWPWDHHITPWRDRGGFVYCEISGFPPQWAKELGVNQNPPTEAGLAEWQEFVTACVRRNITLYGTSAQGGIGTYIIFTEPNSGWEPATYESKTIVIERGVAAIRALDPGASVILEGPWGLNGAAHEANRVVLASGGANDLDEIGIHPFPGKNGTGSNLTAMPDNNDTKGAVMAIAAIARHYGLPSAKVALSEMAYTTHNNTEDNQANGWIRCMALLLSSERVPLLTWAYDWWDCATNLGDLWRLTGARNQSADCWRVPGTKKQVWDAVSTFTHLLGGSEYVGELSLPGANHGFQFRSKSSPYTMTTILWNTDTADNVTLSTPASSLTRYTRQGSSSTVYPSGGRITAATSESPIYLVGEIDEDEWATVDTLARSINILDRAAPAGNKDIWQIRYQTGADFSNKTLTIDIPSGWVAPQVTDSGAAGYVTAEGTASVTLGTVSVNGPQISVPITSADAGDRITVTYGDARPSSYLYDGGYSNYNLDYFPMCGNMKYLDPANYVYGKGDGFTVTGIAGANVIQTANPAETIYRDVAAVYDKPSTTFKVLVNGATSYQVIVYLDPINSPDELGDQTITVNGDGPYDSHHDRRFASVTPDGSNFIEIDMAGDTSNSYGVPVCYFAGVEMIPVGLGGGPTSSASNGENNFVVKLDGTIITNGDQTITVTGAGENAGHRASQRTRSSVRTSS